MAYCKQHGDAQHTGADQAHHHRGQARPGLSSSTSLTAPRAYQRQQDAHSKYLREQEQHAEQVGVDSQRHGNDITCPPAVLSNGTTMNRYLRGLSFCVERTWTGAQSKRCEKSIPAGADEQELQAIGARFLSVDELEHVQQIQPCRYRAPYYPHKAPPQQEHHH